MPLPISLAHQLAYRLAEVRRQGGVDYLRPDGKTQVSVRYRDGVPVAIEKVLISTQHADGGRLGHHDPPGPLGARGQARSSPADLYDESTLSTPTTTSWSTRPASS